MLFSRAAAPICYPSNSARGSPFPASSPALVVSAVTDLSPSDWARRDLSVVSTCLSPMLRDVGHLLGCLLPIRMSSLKTCLFRSSAHF